MNDEERIASVARRIGDRAGEIFTVPATAEHELRVVAGSVAPISELNDTIFAVGDRARVIRPPNGAPQRGSESPLGRVGIVGELIRHNIKVDIMQLPPYLYRPTDLVILPPVSSLSEFKEGQQVEILSPPFDIEIGGASDYTGQVGKVVGVGEGRGPWLKIEVRHPDGNHLLYAPVNLRIITEEPVKKKSKAKSKKDDPLADLYSGSFNPAIRRLKDEIIDNRDAMDYHQENLLKSTVKLKEITQQLEGLKVVKKRKAPDDALRKHILENCYESVELVDGNIVAKTKDITIKYKASPINRLYKYNMGSYDIQIRINDNMIYIKGEKYFNGYCHPHVASDGHPCLGEYSTYIVEAITKGEYYQMLLSLHGFLSDCSNDWYIPIATWHPKINDWCNMCQEKKCKCTGNRMLWYEVNGSRRAPLREGDVHFGNEPEEASSANSPAEAAAALEEHIRRERARPTEEYMPIRGPRSTTDLVSAFTPVEDTTNV